MSEDAASAFYEEAKAAPAAEGKLEALRKLAQRQIDLEQSAAELEEILKATKGSLHELKTKTVPELMAELRLLDFTLESGWTIAVEDFVAGSLPKDEEKRKKAVEELVAEGGQDLIKTTMTLVFSKSQHNEALDLAERLRSDGWEPEVKEDVHPQTLAAFARERLKNGDEVKVDVLGLFSGRTTKVKPPKEVKPKKGKAKKSAEG